MSAETLIVRMAAIAALAAGWPSPVLAGDAEDPARVRRAVAYLDARQEDWSRFAKSSRGEGADKTSCVSCHTGLGYALARPTLRAFAATPGASPSESRLIAAASLRVDHWADLDTPRFELMYDFEDRKKVESRGTEAVLNALLLAVDDASQGRKSPGPAARAALQHLWDTQVTQGDAVGSWEWLDFGLEPWEAGKSRAFGAAMAALAVGMSPGYLDGPLDEPASKGVRSLRDYLGRRFPVENAFNRLAILEASRTFKDLLTPEQRREVVDRLIPLRREDGGWSLASLGDFRRGDGKPQSQESDGYATGLGIHALLLADSPTTRPEVDLALGWLRAHQRPDGSWPARSLNKDRDPATFVGKLMSDAATAMAARALVEADSR